jgi:hypothetical protein
MTTIDCDTCPARGRHCGDCFVSLLIGGWDQGRPTDQATAAAARGEPSGPDRQALPLDRSERAAVGSFVRAGLISPAAADRLRAARTSGGLSAAG